MTPERKSAAKRLEYLLNKPLSELSDAEQMELESLLDVSESKLWESALSDLLKVDEVSLQPNPIIREKLVKELNRKPTHQGFQTRLGSLFSMRIPAYQAALAVALMLIMVLMGGNLSEVADQPQVNRSMNIQFADTTGKDTLNIYPASGRTLEEDSLLAPFRRSVM
ncbi:MAG: hypothetical protein AAFP70_00830 [Calditrichota bacterium]